MLVVLVRLRGLIDNRSQISAYRAVLGEKCVEHALGLLKEGTEVKMLGLPLYVIGRFYAKALDLLDSRLYNKKVYGRHFLVLVTDKLL